MKTIFPKQNYHKPQWFLINAKGLTLGRLSSRVSFLLRGKENSFFNLGLNQSNFVIIINALDVKYTGQKEQQKLYYRNSQRPGSLKTEMLKDLKLRNPSSIIERAVWGMLPKTILGRQMYRNLYVYPNKNIKIIHSKINRIKFIKIISI